jgi:hypothetical protein
MHWALFPTQNEQQNADLRQNIPQARLPFRLLKPASKHAHARLLPRLSRSWIVLLPSDTHRTPITPITALLLPFVTNILTLSRNGQTGTEYHRFLVNDLPVPLKHVPLHQWQSMWLMRDGAPCHFLRTVRQHLNQTFGEKWIGRGGRVNWPARSPNLNPLDFWLWGHLKTLVYSESINDLQVLLQWVENACQEIRVKPGIFDRVATCMRRMAKSFAEIHRNHTQHLLQRSDEHRPYLSRHRLLGICSLELFLLI